MQQVVAQVAAQRVVALVAEQGVVVRFDVRVRVGVHGGGAGELIVARAAEQRIAGDVGGENVVARAARDVLDAREHMARRAAGRQAGLEVDDHARLVVDVRVGVGDRILPVAAVDRGRAVADLDQVVVAVGLAFGRHVVGVAGDDGVHVAVRAAARDDRVRAATRCDRHGAGGEVDDAVVVVALLGYRSVVLEGDDAAARVSVRVAGEGDLVRPAARAHRAAFHHDLVVARAGQHGLEGADRRRLGQRDVAAHGGRAGQRLGREVDGPARVLGAREIERVRAFAAVEDLARLEVGGGDHDRVVAFAARNDLSARAFQERVVARAAIGVVLARLDAVGSAGDRAGRDRRGAGHGERVVARTAAHGLDGFERVGRDEGARVAMLDRAAGEVDGQVVRLADDALRVDRVARLDHGVGRGQAHVVEADRIPAVPELAADVETFEVGQNRADVVVRDGAGELDGAARVDLVRRGFLHGPARIRAEVDHVFLPAAVLGRIIEVEPDRHAGADEDEVLVVPVGVRQAGRFELEEPERQRAAVECGLVAQERVAGGEVARSADVFGDDVAGLAHAAIVVAQRAGLPGQSAAGIHVGIGGLGPTLADLFDRRAVGTGEDRLDRVRHGDGVHAGIVGRVEAVATAVDAVVHARAQHEEVVAAPAQQGVRAAVADQDVVAAAAFQPVVAVAAAQEVVAASAGQSLGMRGVAADQDVGVVRADRVLDADQHGRVGDVVVALEVDAHAVRAAGEGDRVVAEIGSGIGAADDRVEAGRAAVQQVVALAADQDVVGVAAGESVVAAQPFQKDRLVETIGEQEVARVTGRAAQGDHAATVAGGDLHAVLQVGGRKLGSREAERLDVAHHVHAVVHVRVGGEGMGDGDGAVLGELDDVFGDLAAIDRAVSRARAAVERIVVRAADQHVVVRAAAQDVVARAAGQHVGLRARLQVADQFVVAVRAAHELRRRGHSGGDVAQASGQIGNAELLGQVDVGHQRIDRLAHRPFGRVEKVGAREQAAEPVGDGIEDARHAELVQDRVDDRRDDRVEHGIDRVQRPLHRGEGVLEDLQRADQVAEPGQDLVELRFHLARERQRTVVDGAHDGLRLVPGMGIGRVGRFHRRVGDERGPVHGRGENVDVRGGRIDALAVGQEVQAHLDALRRQPPLEQVVARRLDVLLRAFEELARLLHLLLGGLEPGVDRGRLALHRLGHVAQAIDHLGEHLRRHLQGADLADQLQRVLDGAELVADVVGLFLDALEDAECVLHRLGHLDRLAERVIDLGDVALRRGEVVVQVDQHRAGIVVRRHRCPPEFPLAPVRPRFRTGAAPQIVANASGLVARRNAV